MKSHADSRPTALCAVLALTSFPCAVVAADDVAAPIGQVRVTTGYQRVSVAGLAAGLDQPGHQLVVSTRYDFDTASLYAAAARGAHDGYGLFDTDDARSYEFGWQQQLPQWRGHINTAVFYMDAASLNPAAVFVSDTGKPATGALTASGAESWGAGVDLAFYVTETVSWTLGADYLPCEHVPAVQGPRSLQPMNATLHADDGCPGAADWTFRTTVTGEWPIGGTDWVATGMIGVSGQPEMRLASSTSTPPDATLLDPNYLLDITAGVRSKRWTILAYVENATDVLHSVNAFPMERPSGRAGTLDLLAPLAPERRYGLHLRLDL